MRSNRTATEQFLKNNNKIEEYELAEIVIERMIEIEIKKIIFEIQKIY